MNLSRTTEYEDGELLILEGGQTDRAVAVVLEGQVQVVKETERGRVTVALLEEGDVFGEVSFLAQKRGRRSASVLAKGKVKIGILDQEKLTAEYGRLSPTFQKMLRDLSERFTKTTSLAAHLAAKQMKDPNLERRQSKRSGDIQRLRLKVTYYSEPQAGLKGSGTVEPSTGLLLDLAGTGMGLDLLTTTFSKSSHTLGARLTFQFNLPGKPMVRVPGQIVWLREMGGQKARLGVKFTETNPYLQKIIREFLQSVSAE
ncbi:MAG TPA: cyclic nucleotide-binding domain-containing protein [Syntrophobacteria bacterium]|nr:cyclic nucleotide-binding domain-containing protein [Syntrophobacteria bacterium]